MPDYSDYQEAPSEDKLAKLTRLAEELRRAEADVERAAADLKDAQGVLADIAEHQIPALMDELGVETYTLKNGLAVSIKPVLHTSISKDHEDTAFEWMEEHGYGSLIKHQMITDFSKGEDELARATLDAARANGLRAQLSKSVHASTLKSFVKHALEDGEDIPLQTFGVHQVNVAKVTVKG